MSDYDAIVIGSGAGGAAAAYRLVQGGLRVALLEKGTFLPTDGSTLDVRRVVQEGEFLSRERWHDGQGRPLVPEEHFNIGGKTKWYGAALLRFAEHEFQADAALGCAGWPVTLADMTPYYSRIETLLGVRVFDCEADLARIVTRLQRANLGWQAAPMPLALAADITAYPTEAAHFDGFASVRHLKGEAESSLLTPLHGAKNFTLAPNAECTALLGRADDPTVITGTRLSDGSELRAPLVFLAAGALHSPRLLARYLRASGLEARLPGAAQVGRNLKLHLLTAMVALSATVKTDLIRKTVLLSCQRFAHSSAQPLGFDGQLIATLLPRIVPPPLRRQLGQRAYGFFLQTEDGSDPRNRVVDAGALGPVPTLDYDAGRMPAAAREHRSFTRALQFALARAGLLSFAKRIEIKGTAHSCGSLMCGSNPADSVVDGLGRVHGMQGLYVVDGSVLPRSSRVNPSLTIYAWALRVAELAIEGDGASATGTANARSGGDACRVM